MTSKKLASGSSLGFMSSSAGLSFPADQYGFIKAWLPVRRRGCFGFIREQVFCGPLDAFIESLDDLFAEDFAKYVNLSVYTYVRP